jgi:tetratricopeptide (TPR) repeat protein
MLRAIFSRLAIAAALLWLAPSHGSAQWIGDSDLESHIRRGIEFVYNLSFDSARLEFKQVVRSYPDHPAGHFFLATVEWWNILIDIDNTSNDEKFLSLLDNVIVLCDQRLDKDEHDVAAMFFKGGALGFQGRLYGNREDWVKAANAGRQALSIVQQAHKLAPENNDILLGIGIYNYYAEVVPEKYPFVKPLMVFFPKGDKQKGINQLRTASEKAGYADIEATYFLLQLFQNFEGRFPEALSLALRLNKRFPRNPMFHRYVGRCYASMGQWDDMQKTFLEITGRVREHRLGYTSAVEREATYYAGLYEFNRGKYDDALTHFYRCDELSRTLDKEQRSGFWVLALLRMGMIYDIQGKRSAAIEQYNKVMEMPDYGDAHDQARRYLKTAYARS